MNFLYLRAYHGVAVEQSFTRAAQILRVSQSTLSSQVKALEETYGVRLLDRRGRKVTPTDVGRDLLELCHELFKKEEEIEEVLNKSNKLQSGRLKIGADGPRHVVPILKTYLSLHPDMKISISSGNAKKVTRDIIEYNTDVAIIAMESDDNAALHLEKYTTYRLVAFVNKGHHLAQKKSLNLGDFSTENLIMRENSSLTRKLLSRRLDSMGISPRSVIEIDNRDAAREAVANGMGISVMSEVEFGSDDDRTVALKINDPDLTITEYVACLKGRRNTRSIREFFRIAMEAKAARS